MLGAVREALPVLPSPIDDACIILGSDTRGVSAIPIKFRNQGVAASLAIGMLQREAAQSILQFHSIVREFISRENARVRRFTFESVVTSSAGDASKRRRNFPALFGKHSQGNHVMFIKTKIALAATLIVSSATLALAQGFDPNLANRYPGYAEPGTYGYTPGSSSPG